MGCGASANKRQSAVGIQPGSQLAEEFNQMDKNNDGLIDMNDYVNAQRNINNPSFNPLLSEQSIIGNAEDKTIQLIFESLDTDKNNMITFEEFKKAIPAKTDEEKTMRQVTFMQLDTTENGRLSFEEFAKGYAKLMNPLPEELPRPSAPPQVPSLDCPPGYNPEQMDMGPGYVYS